MVPLALDALARLLRLDRSRSMRRRLRRADRAIAAFAEAATRRGDAAGFELEPWTFPVPFSLVVLLAADRGFVPEPGRGARWELRERVRFVPGAWGDVAVAAARSSARGAA